MPTTPATPKVGFGLEGLDCPDDSQSILER
ncbi:Uncharacterised protein [Pseudomonas putida]|nr:hypothetical protein SAMN05216380_1999 [Pseudomonas putida]VTQ42274.1 Uncharacterised protein [Pseudomonas putida]